MISKRIILSLIFMVLVSPFSFSQAPEGPKIYSGSMGGGIATTSGNTDTQNFNLSFDVVRDPKKTSVMKAKAVYLRANQQNVLNVNRTSIGLRDELKMSERTFVFGQLEYLRDEFKEIIFLWAPVGGVGYKVVNNPTTLFQFDGGAGGILERNPGRTVSRSGSLTAGERFQQKLSTIASLTQSISTIWKTSDFDDSLTNFTLGVTTALVKNLELKVEFLDSFKNRPASAAVKKNDTAFITSFIVKF